YEPDSDHPAGTEPPFTIRTVSHQTLALGAASDATGAVAPVPDAGTKDLADTCHLDPNCYPEWTDNMRMVAQLSFEDQGVRFFCSGALVSTRDHSGKPYLLTAGHCMNNEAAARSLEVYWTYQKSSCYAAPPASRENSTKSTKGANLIATAPISGGDFGLVLLKDVPSSVLFADWDLGDPPLQGEVAGIHHPVGSYKRISFGERAVDATYLVEGDLAPGNLFHQVYWKKGRVEHGSSGSPLFSAPGVLIGQLSYSIFSQQLSACKIDPSFAGYGRFSNVYQHA